MKLTIYNNKKYIIIRDSFFSGEVFNDPIGQSIDDISYEISNSDYDNYYDEFNGLFNLIIRDEGGEYHMYDKCELNMTESYEDSGTERIIFSYTKHKNITRQMKIKNFLKTII